MVKKEETFPVTFTKHKAKDKDFDFYYEWYSCSNCGCEYNTRCGWFDGDINEGCYCMNCGGMITKITGRRKKKGDSNE